VTRDVPPYAIVGGNPAALLRYRFDPVVIERLEKLRWWDWDIDRITRNVSTICSGDIAALERAS
jgi:virginiamycin A acetyltransferase